MSQRKGEEPMVPCGPCSQDPRWPHVRCTHGHYIEPCPNEAIGPTLAAKMHIIVEEIRQCINDDELMAGHRKLNSLDALIREIDGERASFESAYSLEAPHNHTLEQENTELLTALKAIRTECGNWQADQGSLNVWQLAERAIEKIGK